MNHEDTTGKKASAAGARQIVEVISGAWTGEEPDFHRLFLFDRLTRGEKNWNFLIVTRSSGLDRLELAAYSYEVGSDGGLKTKLESRKAQIPADRLTEVIEGILLRLDELECDYREFDLGEFGRAESKLEFISQLLGEKVEGESAEEPGTNLLQPGPGGGEPGGLGPGRGDPQHAL
ncbi:MAG: hypothetical protein A3F83_13460 [Candidatus Glassbacteria bacterium RIFCSPLOWO2_12_FULL_58_11]|uniref:Uncharacterized protein n=1 Tax=Candidatus Glassbacteria bacterium RIFCSPLOWO2_12_FULL_58_11 TaxID=1817867 RepID=A0A1F5YML5_9BACT|nr:MAG: hypothetical protein A3F83_13460 [Candidatus Glassbacteria bacterium RIFCSPLOWO2_12_FULL_58_11]